MKKKPHHRLRSDRLPRPPRKPREAAPRTDWSEAASWYDSLVGDGGSEYQQHVVHPGVMRLLDLKPGEPVLDVACGTGALCRLMHEAGAGVTGVDAAAAMIHRAQSRSDPAIRYLTADARQLDRCAPLRDEVFCAATCVLAIQDMDPIAPVFQGVAARLAASGRFVLVMMHPAFRVPRQSAWGWDEKTNVQFRRVDRYLTCRREKILTHPGAGQAGGHTWTFHRPLQDYIAALAGTGLHLDALQEWTSHKTSDPGRRADAENTARREFPLFLALRAVRGRG